MKTVLLALAVVATLLLTPKTLEYSQKVLGSKTTVETVNEAYASKKLPPEVDALAIESEVKNYDVKKILTLEAANTVILRGPVTETSVSKAIKDLQRASNRVSKSTPLYLVLDTPGGSVFDGMDLISFAKALPQKVHTVTLFAASMGFQIAQNLNNRFIITNGTLMSHRASVSGFGGQIKGEFETRYKMIRRAIDYLDNIAAGRMGMSLKDYENTIFNEYWVHGYDAITQKAADEQVLVRCGDSLMGTETVEFATFFGTVELTFSKCPLIRAPEKVDLADIAISDYSEVKKAVDTWVSDKPDFVRDYIVTSKFQSIFK